MTWQIQRKVEILSGKSKADWIPEIPRSEFQNLFQRVAFAQVVSYLPGARQI